MEQERKNLSAGSFDQIIQLVNRDRGGSWEVEYIITYKNGVYSAQLVRNVDNRHEAQLVFDELINELRVISKSAFDQYTEYEVSQGMKLYLMGIENSLDNIIADFPGRFENALGDLLATTENASKEASE